MADSDKRVQNVDIGALDSNLLCLVVGHLDRVSRAVVPFVSRQFHDAVCRWRVLAGASDPSIVVPHHTQDANAIKRRSRMGMCSKCVLGSSFVCTFQIVCVAPLPVLTWAHAQRLVRLAQTAIAAAETGRLDVLQHMHTMMDLQKCGGLAMAAARRGDVVMLDWMRVHALF